MSAEPLLAAFAAADRSRRALFVTYGGGHVTKVAPVVRELERQGVSCLVVALTVGYQKARQLGLQPLGYKDFLHLVDKSAVLARGESLLAGNQHPEVDRLESCCYLGVNYLEWVESHGEDEAARRYQERGRQAFAPVRFFGRIIDTLQPGVVVATSSPRSEQAAIEAAVHRGVPALTMVDLFAPPSDPFLRRSIHADRVTVISEEVRANFIASGLEPWRVVTTGSPDFDSLFAPGAQALGLEFRRSLGWEGKKVVLWAGYREHEGPGVPPEYAGTSLGTAVEKTLRHWVSTGSDRALVVRYHPSHYHEFPDLGPQERVHTSIPGKEALLPVLHAADVVVNQVSTVGLEAALVGKRVLNLEFSPSVAQVDFDLSSLGPSEPVAALDVLVAAIERGGLQPTARKMTVPPGSAAPRVASEVLGLLNTFH